MISDCPKDEFLVVLFNHNIPKIKSLRINDNAASSELNLQFHLRAGISRVEWVTDDKFVAADSGSAHLLIFAINDKKKLSFVVKIDVCSIFAQCKDLSIKCLYLKSFAQGLIAVLEQNYVVTFAFDKQHNLEPRSILRCDHKRLQLISVDLSSKETSVLFGFTNGSCFKEPFSILDTNSKVKDQAFTL